MSSDPSHDQTQQYGMVCQRDLGSCAFTTYSIVSICCTTSGSADLGRPGPWALPPFSAHHFTWTWICLSVFTSWILVSTVMLILQTKFNESGACAGLALFPVGAKQGTKSRFLGHGSGSKRFSQPEAIILSILSYAMQSVRGGTL
jgi:hypothetical protein